MLDEIHRKITLPDNTMLKIVTRSAIADLFNPELRFSYLDYVQIDKPFCRALS